MKTHHMLLLSAFVFLIGLVSGMQLGSDSKAESSVVTESQATLAPQCTVEPDEPKSQPQTLAVEDLADRNELRQLQQRVSDLEQQLVAKDLQLDVAEQRQMGLPETAEQGSKPSLSTLSLQQAQSFLPEPFASLMAKQKGRAVDYLNQHQAEEVDSEWAYDIEQKVQDYFALHENAAKLQLSSVSCKTSICEIRGYEYQPDFFIATYNTMQMQNWWRFGSSYAFQSNDKESTYFYILAELKR